MVGIAILDLRNNLDVSVYSDNLLFNFPVQV